MNFLLKVWRQMNSKTNGKLVNYEATNISPNTSFLEMLDIVNERLVERGEEPIAFDSDCREGICGACSLTINRRSTFPRARADTAGPKAQILRPLPPRLRFATRDTETLTLSRLAAHHRGEQPRSRQAVPARHYLSVVGETM
jgi:hypothetical protein